MKTFLRLLSLLLAVLMIAAMGVVFVSCDDDNGDGSGFTSEYDAAFEPDKLSSDLNYLGETVYVLAWKEGHQKEREFEYEGVEGDVVDDAVAQRNDQIEGRLNVELKFTFTEGTDRANFIKYVDGAYNSQDGAQPLDIIATYSRTAGTLAQRGYLKDIKKLGLTEEQNWFDFNAPWWPSNFMEELSFGDSTYFFSGDISTSLLYNMVMIYVNKNMFNSLYNGDARALGYDDGMSMLYDLVIEKEWTLAKLIEFSDYYENLGADSWGAEDRFGFSTIRHHVEGFYTGAELRYVETDPVEMLVISKDFNSKKAVTLINQLSEFFASESNYSERYNNELDPSLSEGHNVPFTKGNCIFLMGRAYLAEQVMAQKVSFPYGVVPVPMYGTPKSTTYKQNNYYTAVGNPVSLFGIFINSYHALRSGEEHTNEAEHLSMLTAVLECWASENYRRTTPAIFYIGMMNRYSDAPEDATMYQYVRNGITFDLGRIFADALSTMAEMPAHCAMSDGSSWSIYYSRYKTKLNAQMKDLVKAFEAQGTNAQ